MIVTMHIRKQQIYACLYLDIHNDMNQANTYFYDKGPRKHHLADLKIFEEKENGLFKNWSTNQTCQIKVCKVLIMA